MKSNIIPFYTSTEKLIVRSKGCYQYDSDEKRYIDFEAGVWCANLGHGNDQIMQALIDQMTKSAHHGYKFRNAQAEFLSRELNSIIGFQNGSSVFLSSGSEAVNLSVTMARHITGRKKILKISNSYLSAYGFGQISPDNDNLVNVAFNDQKSTENIDFSDIATFIVETGGASIDVVRFPDKPFISDLIETARKNNCLIIAEEVTTGMGRTGKWFGFMHYDFKPDIVVTGKALGNGFPVSAVTIDEHISKKFKESPFRYAQSHQNDPLGCSAGIEVIRLMKDEDIPRRSFETGIYFKNRLKSIQDKFPTKITDVRGRGLMLALEFSDEIDGEVIHDRLFENGFITGYKSNTLRFMPPLIIEQTDIDCLAEKLTDIIASYKN